MIECSVGGCIWYNPQPSLMEYGDEYGAVSKGHEYFSGNAQMWDESCMNDFTFISSLLEAYKNCKYGSFFVVIMRLR